MAPNPRSLSLVLATASAVCGAHTTFAPSPLPLLRAHIAPKTSTTRCLPAINDYQRSKLPAARASCRMAHEAVPASTAPAPLQPRAWRTVRSALLRLPSLLLAALMIAVPRGVALASGGLPASIPAVPLSKSQLLVRLCLWIGLFSMAALFAGAETAITTLWPWKVKQLAAEEGDDSPFASLQTDITKVLGTVLIGVTFCTIFGTALATDVAVGIFGKAGVGYATIGITLVTVRA